MAIRSKVRSDGSELYLPCGNWPIQFKYYKPHWKGPRTPRLWIAWRKKYKSCAYSWLIQLPWTKGRVIDIWRPRYEI